MGSLSDLDSSLSIQRPNPIFLEDSYQTLEFPSENSPKSYTKKDTWLKKKKKKNQVLLEGYVATDEKNDPILQDQQQQQGTMSRAKSLTDGDLDELKGCLDLGFGFNYEEIPELCNTLPALELCYSMSQRFLDDQQQQQQKSADGRDAEDACSVSSAAASPIANWKISSPGDHPEDVKLRLKFWAQAVACTVRLCS
ncbi:uncharacterized protein LOC131246354 [Magnolia sinica]|uniref:uncharacterized protein LOC131246354 n=1 Tax=Magnolia sinica TaxID=86752 RepID=UPI0026598010|nr:uncharacterized protein LOC131246354 [Magnolia sinica]